MWTTYENAKERFNDFVERYRGQLGHEETHEAVVQSVPVLPQQQKLLPRNPGTMDTLHKECTDVIPATFNGGRCVVNNALSNHFNVAHRFSMDRKGPLAYSFGATYIGSTDSPENAHTILLAEIDRLGVMSSTIVNQLSDCARIRITSKTQPHEKLLTSQIHIDLQSQDSSLSCLLYNANIVSHSATVCLQYLQAITPKLTLGTEFCYSHGLKDVPGGAAATALSGSFKYYSDSFALAATISNMMALHATYYRKCAETLKIGVELETAGKLQNACSVLAYEFSVPANQTIIRGMIDSEYNVGCLIEKGFQSTPFLFSVSSRLDNAKSSLALGVGFIIN